MTMLPMIAACVHLAEILVQLQHHARNVCREALSVLIHAVNVQLVAVKVDDLSDHQVVFRDVAAEGRVPDDGGPLHLRGSTMPERRTRRGGPSWLVTVRT